MGIWIVTITYCDRFVTNYTTEPMTPADAYHNAEIQYPGCDIEVVAAD